VYVNAPDNSNKEKKRHLGITIISLTEGSTKRKCSPNKGH
jgi:hypothetical protein